MDTSTPPPKQKSIVYIWKHLFQYSSGKNRFLQAIATLAACGAGAVIPCVMILWGRLSNSFLRFAKHDPSYTPAHFQKDINEASLIIVYLFFAKLVLGYIYMVLFTITAADIARDIRVKYVEVALNQDVSTVENTSLDSAGGVGQAITEIERIEMGLGEQFGYAIQLLSVIVSAFIISLISQWKLGLVVSTMIPLTVVTVGITVILDIRLENSIQQVFQAASNVAKDALGNIRDIFSCTAEADVLFQYDKLMETAMRIGFRKAPIIGLQYSFELFFVTLGYALSFWYGSKLYSAGGVSIGDILTVFFCVALANSSLTGISVQIHTLIKALSAAGTIVSMTDSESETSREDGTFGLHTLDLVEGELQLDRVSFSYPNRPQHLVYTQLSCHIPARKVTAIIGASGAGKSTIVALVERWFDVNDGCIRLDGTDIRQLDVSWLRKQIGVVEQEPTLFNGSIYSNVSRGLVGTPHESKAYEEKLQMVQKACELANATTFISSLPKKYDTWVGPKGTFLSGGQKQRLAIARAVISDPRILILDEATAALDVQNEGAVQLALEEASHGRTTICITHKPKEAMKADNVLVFSSNGVEEHGAPQDLVKSAGLFAKFMTSEMKHESDTSIEGQLRTTKKTPTYDIKTDVVLNEQLDVTSQMTDHSLIYCMAIILYRQRQHWRWMIALLTPCLLGGMIFFAEAILFGKMVSIFQRIPADVHSGIKFWALMFLILSFATLIIYALIGHNGSVLSYKMGREHRSQYLAVLLKQPVSFFDKPENSPGVLTVKLSQHTNALEDLLGNNTPVIIIILVTIASCSALAIATGWRLGLVAVFGCLVPICIMGISRIYLESSIEEKNHQFYSESAAFASEYLAALRTVKALGLETALVNEYRTLLEGPLRKAKKASLSSMGLLAFADSLQICGMALSFWYGGTLLASRSYNLQNFFTIFSAVIFGAQATSKLFGFAYSFTKGKFAANHFLGWSAGVSRASVEIIEDNTAHGEKGDAISFVDVSFRYPSRDSLVLRELNFVVKNGQKVAFVGSSGCGKSTLMALIQRLYEPSFGQIYVDGEDVASRSVKETRQKMAIVPQDHFLYRGSLRENLCLGLDAHRTDAELQEACEAAAILDFVNSLPDGFQTLVGGSGGATFSGGQRQRLLIARALLRRPRILLLDEATSALDAESERIFTKTIMDLPTEMTVVAVAHRFSTIKDFDVIYVLQHGRIVESGTYQALVNQRGPFYHMVSLAESDR